MEIVFVVCSVYFAAYSTALFFVAIPIWAGLSVMLVSVVVAVLYTSGAAEYASNVFRHTVLFAQAIFITVLLSIGCEDKRRLFAVALCTLGCFAVSAIVELWMSTHSSEE